MSLKLNMESAALSVSSPYHSATSSSSVVIIAAVSVFYLNLLCYYNMVVLFNFFSDLFSMDRRGEIAV